MIRISLVLFTLCVGLLPLSNKSRYIKHLSISLFAPTSRYIKLPLSNKSRYIKHCLLLQPTPLTTTASITVFSKTSSHIYYCYLTVDVGNTCQYN